MYRPKLMHIFELQSHLGLYSTRPTWDTWAEN